MYQHKPPSAPERAPRTPPAERAAAPRDPEGNAAIVDRLKTQVGRSTDVDLSAVAVDTDAGGQEAAGAEAAFVGDRIVLGPAFGRIGRSEQERVLAHELVHVAQAWSGPVPGADPSVDAEQDAERVASDALAGERTSPAARIDGGVHRYTPAAPASGPIATAAARGWLARGTKDAAGTRLVQAKLQSLGFRITVVDGIFGDQTHAAVVAYQRSRNLADDGKVGPVTAARMDAEGGASTKPPTPTPAPATGESRSIAAIVAAEGSLSMGSRNTAGVKALQGRLKELGYAISVVDGIFGRETHAAVVRFQQDRRVTPYDGIVGRLTSAAIDNAGKTTTPAGPTPATPAPSTPSAPPSAGTAGMRAHVDSLVARAGDKTRYDAIYSNGANGAELKAYMEGAKGSSANATGAYPEAGKGLGFDHVKAFLDSGGYDRLTDREKEIFQRNVDQLGSFYGRSFDIANGYDWLPSQASASDKYANQYVKQRDGLVGKWDCSSLSSYVQGRPYADTSGLLPVSKAVDWNAIAANPVLAAEALPVGTILVRAAQGDSGAHTKNVLGHIGTDVLLTEAEGSKTFVHAERHKAADLARTHSAYKAVKP